MNAPPPDRNPAPVSHGGRLLLTATPPHHETEAAARGHEPLIWPRIWHSQVARRVQGRRLPRAHFPAHPAARWHQIRCPSPHHSENTSGPADDAPQGEGTRRHGRLPRTHRPQAGTAIRWPRSTPPRIPSRGRRNTGVPDPEDVPPAVATTGTTPACCPGPAARCVRRRAAREASFRNKRRSTNAGDAEVDA